jgi:hypothetical protein
MYVRWDNTWKILVPTPEKMIMALGKQSADTKQRIVMAVDLRGVYHNLADNLELR